MVTLLPKSAYIEANSSPIYPPPTIVSFFGNSSRFIIDSDVYTPLLSAPSIFGITVTEPVFIINFSASISIFPSFVETMI